MLRHRITRPNYIWLVLLYGAETWTEKTAPNTIDSYADQRTSAN